MGWLSKTTDLRVQFDEEVIFQNQIFVRKTDLNFLVQGGPDITEFAVGESTNCDSLIFQKMQSSFALKLSPEEGPKNISYKYRSGETESDCRRYPVVMDSTSPQALTFTATGDLLSGGMQYVGPSKEANLQMSAQNASEMKISQDDSCQSGEWEPYSTQKNNVFLQGMDGKKNLSIVFRNKFKQTTSCLSAFVQLDSTGPDVSAWMISYAPLATEQVDTTQTPTFSWAANPVDADIGFAFVEFALGTTMQNDNIRAWQVISGLTGSAGGLNLSIGQYYMNFRTRDTLGNMTVIPSRSLLVKPAVPTVNFAGVFSNPGNIANISIESLIAAGQTLNIYDNASCAGTLRGTATSAGSTLTVPMLHLSADGNYNFYAEAVQNGVSSGCSPTPLAYTLDRTPPTVQIKRTGLASGNQTNEFSWNITFQNSQPVSLSTSHIELVGPGSGCVPSLQRTGDAEFIYRLNQCTGYGLLGLRVLANTASDVAGNGNLAYTALASESVNLTNGILVEFSGSGDVVNEGFVTTSHTLSVRASGSSTETIRVWYEVLSESTHLQTAPAWIYNLNRGYVDILAGQTTASIGYQYYAQGTTQGTRSLHVAISALTSASSTSPINYAPVRAYLGTHQVFRRVIAASDNSAQVESVVTGSQHSCLLDSLGQIKCWGESSNGEIGSAQKYYSTAIRWDGSSGLTYKAVVVGVGFTCGLTMAGYLRCSGRNNSGQLGIGSSGVSATTPVNAGYSSAIMQIQFAKISAGQMGLCGIENSTSYVYCWGANEKGESGSGSFGTSVLYARQISSDAFVSIARGSTHACGVLATGGLRCWGDGTYGQIGADNSSGTASFVNPDLGFANYVKVFAGSSTSCAINSSNILRCWGRYITSSGTFSISGFSSQARTVRPESEFRSVAMGSNHFCGLISETSGPANAGRMVCYGANDQGQLGLGDMNTSLITSGFLVNNGDYFLQTSAGGSKTCAVDPQKILKCWGSRLSPMGDGGYVFAGTPLAVDAATNYLQVSNGEHFSCAITTDNDLKCWGVNYSGQVGDSTTTLRSAPILIDTGVKYSKVSVGTSSACAITTTGRLKCWGENSYGQIGDGGSLNYYVPASIDTATSYLDVKVGGRHACAITQIGQMKCWGDNRNGQLGLGNLVSPVRVPSSVDSSVRYNAIALGDGHTCGITTDNGLKCWGSNASGQLGDGSVNNQVLPVAVGTGGVAYVKVASGYGNTCALSDVGVLYCWGGNLNGEVPGQSGSPITTPQVIYGAGSVVTGISVGSSQICSVNSQNQAYCWGNHYYDPSEGAVLPTTSNTPVQIVGLNVSSIVAGTMHDCLISTTGKLSCWGRNRLSALGDGQADASLPVAIYP